MTCPWCRDTGKRWDSSKGWPHILLDCTHEPLSPRKGAQPNVTTNLPERAEEEEMSTKFNVRIYSDHAIVDGELVEPLSKLGARLIEMAAPKDAEEVETFLGAPKAKRSEATEAKPRRTRRTKVEVAAKKAETAAERAATAIAEG